MREEKTNREKRRRRRVRNQILAYLTLLILIVLVLIAGYFGVRYIIDYVNKYNDKVNRVIEEAESSAFQDSDDEIDDTESKHTYGIKNKKYLLVHKGAFVLIKFPYKNNSKIDEVIANKENTQ